MFSVTNPPFTWRILPSRGFPCSLHQRVRLRMNSETKSFPQSRAIISCRSRFYYILEEMADMDELFGSDGDSDNDQRGDDFC